MVTQTGAPDWILSLWAWEKPKLLATAKITPSMDRNFGGLVNFPFTVAINPSDSSQISVIGPNVFKMMRLQEGAFKNSAVAKIETRVLIIYADL